MQVTETLNDGLKRELKVVIPAAQLEQRMMTRLGEMAASARIPGFRPGKVPVNHLKKIYGKSVMAEVVQQTLDDSSKEALVQQNLKPAYQPEIGLTEDEQEIKSVIDGESDLSYTMTFEIVPTVAVDDFSELEFDSFQVDVSDEHVEESLTAIANQYRDFEPRAEGAKAEAGDRVIISFVGRVDGTEFEGGSAESVPLELGSNSFIPGFEDQLVGTKVGDDVVVKVTFPDDYAESTLAGKDAEFSVAVTEVEGPKEAEVDDELAQRLGIEDLAKLKDMVREQVGSEFSKMTEMKLKRDVLDTLDTKYRFELPEKLVEAEFNQIWAALTREMEQQKQTFEDDNTTEEDARKEYNEIAERRVRLGLVLGTIGEQAGIQVSEEEMQQALMERARQFPGQEKQVFDFYRNNPDAMIELRGPIFEQKVVTHIAEKSKINEKSVSREEMMKLIDDPDHDPDQDGDKKPAKKAAAKKPAKKAAKKPAKKAAADENETQD